MTTPITTSTTDSQMHNNIMAAGLKDRPPMLAMGRYAKWQSRFLRNIDTRSNGDALRKCNLQGPYTPSNVIIPAVPTTDNTPAVHERTTDGESMESYYSRFYKMMNEMIRNNLTVATMQVNVQFLQQLQPEWSRFVKIIKKQHELDTVSYHKLFDILKQYQKEVNEIHAERIANNANLLALVAAAQPHPDPYYQAPKSHKSYATQPKASPQIRSHTTTRHKGKEIAKPITPLFESASDEDNDPEQAQKDKKMQKNFALIAKYFKNLYKPTNNNLRTSSNSTNKNVDTNLRHSVVQQTGIQCFNYKEFGHFPKECMKPKRVKDSMYHKEKMLLKQAKKGVSLQAKQSDWLADTDEEINEQELEAALWQRSRRGFTADLGTDTEPLD
nr:hypothetical protein [Tanacetum cinerariifolium]